MTAGPAEIHISGVSGIPEIASGDDVARLIADAALAEGGPGLRAGDILVVTSKVVSKAEGRVVIHNSEWPSVFFPVFQSSTGSELPQLTS